MVTTLLIDFSHAQGQLTPMSVMESCRNSNPSKLLLLTLFPARKKKIHWKVKVLEWSQRFSHYKSTGIFPNAQGQLTYKSFVGYCQISNPEILWVSLLPARMKILSKMKALEWSQHYSLIFHTLMAANSEGSDGILPKFKPIQAFMADLVTCMNEENYWKMKALEWSQRFSHYKSTGIFPNAQGQLTHKSFVGYCPIWNPSNILWLSSLPARIKKNQSKIKELEWSQGFSAYNPMRAICCHGNQSSDPIWPKT